MHHYVRPHAEEVYLKIISEINQKAICSIVLAGYKMSRPVCQNRLTGEEVEEELCNDSQKPDSTVAECNTHNCPPKYVYLL